MGLHRNAPESENHIIQSLSYADAAARTSATGLVASDCGRVAVQQDNNSFWVLTNHSPVTWESMGGAGGGDVSGPSVSVNNRIAVFSGTTGKIIADGGSLITDLLDLAGTRSMTGNLNMGSNNITSVGLVDGVDVSNHTARHVLGGADEINGDLLGISWNPANYTPTTSPAEVTNVDHLTAHLAGIDDVLGSGLPDNDAIHDNVSGEIAAITLKTTPVSADLLLIEDSAETNAKKRITVGTLPFSAPGHTHTEADITDLDHTDADAIHDNVSGEISAVTEKATPVNADLLLIEDSAETNAKKRVQVGNLPYSAPGHTHTEADITDLDHTDADAFHVDVTSEVNGLAEKTTPDNADILILEDSAAGFAKRKVQVGNLPGGGGGGAPDTYYATSTGTTTVSGSQWQDLTGMTLTPPSGSYVVLFDSDVDPPSSAGEVSIRVGGTVVDESVRDIDLGSSNQIGISTQARVTVNGSEDITASYLGTSSATFQERSLIVIRITAQ